MQVKYLTCNKPVFGVKFSESANKYFSKQIENLPNIETKAEFVKKLYKLKKLKTSSDNDKLYMYLDENKIRLVFYENNNPLNPSHTILTKDINSCLTDKDLNKILKIMQFFKIKNNNILKQK